MATISAVIITHNEASNIGRCIDSLQAVADEIIVVDSNSLDETERICRNKDVFFYTREFISFSNQKNYANTLANSDYILSLDADECLSSELITSLLLIKQNMNCSGYTMNRCTSYAGIWIRTCGWYPDTKLRIWQKNNGNWEGEGIHEILKLTHDKSISHLKGDILHYSYQNVHHMLDKIQKYSDLYAQDQRFKKFPSGFKIFYKTVFTFVKNYFFQRGIFDGYKGFLVSMHNTNHTFYKYTTLKEENKDLGVSLVISTYNKEDSLELVLIGVLQQSELPNEIIIADDGSNKNTKELLERYIKKTCIPIIHCWHDDLGFRLSTIRNKAMTIAHYEYIIMIDGDIVMHRHFIKNHKQSARVDQLIQGTRVFLNETATAKYLTSKNPFISLFSRGVINRFSAVYSILLSKLTTYYIKNTNHIRGANMSFWKKDLIKVNGFNEHFIGWGCEDLEFVERIMSLGIRCKRLRFLCIGYHLYHKRQSRDTFETNNTLLNKTRQSKKFRCEKGIDQYIKT